MEREEREQIPWSTLVAEVEPRVDRRWYVAAALAGVIAVVVFGFRAFGGSAQPNDPGAVGPPDAPATLATSAIVTPTMLVSEDDLLQDLPPEDARIAARAEWFVTDYFTKDDSPETDRSIREAMGITEVDDVASGDPTTVTTYVEWARAVAAKPTDASATEVTVLYRMIRSGPDGFVRQPVRAVTVVVGDATEGLLIEGHPTDVDIDSVLTGTFES